MTFFLGPGHSAMLQIFSEREVALVTTIAYRPRTRVPGQRKLPPRFGWGGAAAVQHAYATQYSGEDSARYVHGAAALSASLDRVGSRVDRVAITAYLAAGQRARLRASGWCVLDATERPADRANASRGVDMLRFYRPVFSEEQARREHRPWTQPTQQRRDGAATYYKFLAWTLAGYRRLLVVDSDTVLTESPDRFLTHQPPYFAATPATDERSYRGFISHLMVLTPDAGMFGQILAKAASGQYLAYTNTDQDVLETMFTAAADALPRHVHHPPQITGTAAAHGAALATRGAPECPAHLFAPSLQRSIDEAVARLAGPKEYQQ